MTQIVHLADIHIGEGGSTRTAEYAAVIDKINVPEGAIVVIAGDIFHYYRSYTSDDISLFTRLIDRLSRHNEVIIIPGNHDVVMQNNDKIDLISPLVAPKPPAQLVGDEYWADPLATMDRPRVHYWRRSGIYELAGFTFLHISVKCKIPQEEILALVANKILLYHGNRVEGAPFATNIQITAEMMREAELCLLGDIHKREILKSANAAYSGSLIQQNRGESRDKGYLIWTKNKTWHAEVVLVENPCGFATVDITGKSDEEACEIIRSLPRDANIKRCIKTDRQTLSDVVMKTVYDNYSGVTIEYAPKFEDSTIETVVEQLRASLREQALEDKQIETTINEFLSEGVEHEVMRWYPVRVQWSNYFKYGPNNVVEFKPHVVSGLTAPNCSGKSSLIDIIMIGLFGKTPNAKHTEYVRRGEKSASLRIDFIADGQSYTILRTDTAGTQKQSGVVRFTKGDEILNGVNIKQTYVKIRKMIGTLAAFTRSTLFKTIDDDIFHLSKAKRMQFCPQLFGLIDPVEMVEIHKNKLADAANKIAELKKPAEGTPHNIPDIENSLLLKQNRAADVKREIDEINDKIVLCMSKINRVTESSLLKELERYPAAENVNVEDIQSRLDQWAMLAENTKYSPCEITPAELRELIAELDNHPRVSTVGVPRVEGKSDMTLADAVRVAPATEAEYAEHPGEPPSVPQNTKPYAGYTPPAGIVPVYGELPTLFAELVKLPKGAPGAGYPHLPRNVKERQHASRRPTVPAPTRDTFTIELDVLSCAIMEDQSNKINILTAEYNKILSGTNFTFGDDCAHCKSNSTYVSSRIVEINAELQILRAHQQNYMRYIGFKAELQQALDYEHNKEVDSAEEYNKLVRESNAYYDNLDYIEYQTALGKFYSTLQYEIEQTTVYDKYMNALDKYTKYKAWELFRSAAIIIHHTHDARRKIEEKVLGGRAYAYLQYTDLQKQLEAARAAKDNSKTRDRLLAELPAARESDAAKKQICDLEPVKTALISELTNLEHDIRNTSAKIDRCKLENEVHKNYTEKYPELAAELRRLTVYNKVINSGMFRKNIVTKHLTQLVERTNDLLRESSSFQLKCTITNDIDFEIVESNGNTFDVGRGSGFQKHILSLTFRMALSRWYPHSGHFIVIDEGFNSFDAQNIMLASHLVSTLAEYYMAMIIITHNHDLAPAIDHIIGIQIIDGASQIVDGIPQGIAELPPQAAADKPQKKAKTVPAVIGDLALLPPPRTEGDQYYCPCGATIKNASVSSHKSSTKHIKSINALLERLTFERRHNQQEDIQ